jgi:imidazolonepropionase-like amidohydrolase
VVGLAGYLNQTHDQDQLDRTSAFQPELRAIDAYNPREVLVEHLRVHGITTVNTGHGPGALASGQTMIVKTSGETVQEALVDSVYSVAFTLGSSVSSNFNNPGSRSRMMAMLRAELLKAQEYAAKETKTRDLRMEILGDVLSGKVKAMITAHRATEIQSALRLKEEFGLDLVLDGASEAYLMLEQIKAAKVTVIVHPTMIRPVGEAGNATSNQRILKRADKPRGGNVNLF